ncbi:type VI secretion system-associated protein TagF [Stenotrophomonas sp. CD2]|nr:type VI secretion system-associated protein TagF [Stenotrophomonas sp. CD2]
MSRVVSAGVSYFGKVPSRGDFVRAADNHQLLGWLDRWAGESLELLSQSPDWKQRYDEAPEIHYAFLGSRSKMVLCGHFLASRDASERRFPLLSALRLDAPEPLPFIGRSPLAMSNAWSGLARLARQAYQDSDAAQALAQLADARFSISTDPGDYNGSFRISWRTPRSPTSSSACAIPAMVTWRCARCCRPWACCCSRCSAAVTSTSTRHWCSHWSAIPPIARWWRHSGSTCCRVSSPAVISNWPC